MSAELIRELLNGMQMAYDAVCRGFTDEALLHLGHHIAKANTYLATPPAQPSGSEGSVPDGVGMDVVFARAVRWWESKRPVAWSQPTHAINPVVNCSTDEEARLARAVANVIAAAPQPTTKKG